MFLVNWAVELISQTVIVFLRHLQWRWSLHVATSSLSLGWSHSYAELMYLLNFESLLKAASAVSTNYSLCRLTLILEANRILKHNVSTFP